MKRLFLILPLLVIVLSFRPLMVVAQSTSASDQSTSLVIPCDTTVTDENGNVTIANPCTIEDFLNQFVRLSMYGMSGVLVLGMLMMVYGGVQFVTAGGRASKVDEGKRVMLGTITGIMISLAAYVIINFSISAITGTSRPATDYVSGPIAILFGGQPGLERPFSGSNNGSNGPETRSGCRASTSSWDKTCGNQIYCADPGTKDGAVVDLQKKLNAKNCNCGGADGCFGSATFSCVREFQIANQLPPTGQVDSNTQRLIDSSTGSKNCNDPLVTSLVSGVEAQLPPPPSNNPVLSASPSTTGCCIVSKASGATSQALFCADLVTERTCLTQGAGNVFIPGKYCAAAEQARSSCGFCYDQNGSCFQQASPYWCSNIVQPSGSMSFSLDRTCLNNHPLCGAGCSNGLFVTNLSSISYFTHMRRSLLIGLLAIVLIFAVAPAVSAAVTIPNPIKCNTATCLISQVIRYVLGIIALLATLMFVWGGVMMLTSGGNAKRVEQAKETLAWAAIGVVVVLISWSIIVFVVRGITG